MPANTKEIKRRIRAVGNTRKITKAMELVAAAKMRRAIQSVLATRAYSKTAWSIVSELARFTDQKHHPLLEGRQKVKKLQLVCISSNRGLSGSFAKDLIDTAAGYIVKKQQQYPGMTAEIVLLGKKGKELASKHGHPLVAQFSKVDVAAAFADITPIAKIVIEDFINKKTDLVSIVYTDFISTLKQRPEVVELLPLVGESRELGSIGVTQAHASTDVHQEFLYEPSADVVLEQMLRRLVEVQLYQALLESNASEHSARMVAMRQASDAASDMINDLTFAFNQARQEAITTELADISGGRAALE